MLKNLPHLEIKLATENDYREWKKILDIGKHPAFIGHNTMGRNAENGGAIFYRIDGENVAVSLINPKYGILLAMNVRPEFRGKGIGEAIIVFLMPNFVRAISDKVSWFEKRGYRKIGKPKQGITLTTQIMAREALFHLAGNLRKAWQD